MIYLLHSHLNSFNLSRRESHEDPPAPARPLGITWDRTPIQHGSANVLCLTQCKCVRFATHTLRSTIKSHFGLDVKRHIHRPHNFVPSSPDTQDMPNDIPSFGRHVCEQNHAFEAETVEQTTRFGNKRYTRCLSHVHSRAMARLIFH